MAKDEFVQVDLENEELQIKTDSDLGSGHKMVIMIYDSSTDTNIAAFTVTFDAKISYHVGKCTKESANDEFGKGSSPNVPTTDKDKIWRITETAGSLRVW